MGAHRPAAYHVTNPAPGLGNGEDLRNALTLVFVVAAAAVLLVAALRTPRPPHDAIGVGTERA